MQVVQYSSEPGGEGLPLPPRFSRPDDERFLSLSSLHDAVKARTDRAAARTVETREVRVEANRDDAERLALLLMGATGSVQAPALRPVFVAGAASASFIWFAALGYGARILAPLFARPAAWKVLDGVVVTIMLAMAAALLGRLVR